MKINSMRLRSIAFGITAMAAFWMPSAQAGGTVVVELYTSQGCSSCPPADRVLSEIGKIPGVLPLSLNVDYWDYLGWKDDLALPGNSKRQRSYSRAMRSRHVYTPQMVFDGKMDVVGSRKRQVMSALETFMDDDDPVSVKIEQGTGGRFTVTAPATALDQEAVIWVVGYDREVSKKIGAGENAGRTITYTNVVRDWKEASRWNGRVPLSISQSRPKGDGGYAVIVQEGEVGPILGAAHHEY